MKKTIWDIKEGDTCFLICGNGNIECETWDDRAYQRAYRDNFSAFLTCEEAEAEVEVRKKKALALKPKPILDDAERRYLKAVIRPFRDRVVYIEKRKTYRDDEEYINISFGFKSLVLPDFKRGAMYKGMELYKAYVLEELGL